MTEQPKQRFRGLVHLPRANEDEPARMAIESSALPDTSRIRGWESSRQWLPSQKNFRRNTPGSKHIVSTTPVGKTYAQIMSSDIPVNIEGKNGSHLSFSVDDFVKHFGAHPEDVTETNARHQRIVSNRNAKKSETQVAAVQDDIKNSNESIASAPSSKVAPIVKAPSAEAPKSSAVTQRCSHCKATSTDPIDSIPGLLWAVDHHTGECKYG